MNEDDSMIEAKENPKNIKEAIIDLYLAIKIRSTEELDRINDGNLQDEKTKLMDNFDCFQILEYIRSSIEIIMNLKIEDLEKNEGGKKNLISATNSQLTGDQLKDDTSIDGISIESKNLIQQSMKDALIHMMEQNENASNRQPVKKSKSLPSTYEKIMQKLEADIRGHIRLEHEMKIHMDYLEGKVEKFEKTEGQKDEIIAQQ